MKPGGDASSTTASHPIPSQNKTYAGHQGYLVYRDGSLASMLLHSLQMLQKTSPAWLSLFSFYIYKLDWGISQARREDSHTLSVFLRGFQRAWSNSSPTNPQAVDDHKSNLISCQWVKTVFPFCFLSGMREQVQGHTRDPAKVQGMEDRTPWDV